MQQNLIDSKSEENTPHASEQGVRYNPEALALEGIYTDELSAHRARKGWTQVLQSYFLLDRGHDFGFVHTTELQDGRFALSCHFETACARYVFWRLTNNQAAEAQYLIETAHIPHCESRQEDLLEAADLKAIKEDLETPYFYTPSRIKSSMSLSRILRKIVEVLRP